MSEAAAREEVREINLQLYVAGPYLRGTNLAWCGARRRWTGEKKDNIINVIDMQIVCELAKLARRNSGELQIRRASVAS